MKRYILEYNPFDERESSITYPYINASGIASQEVLSGPDHSEIFFPEAVSFKGMRLDYGAEAVGVPSEPHALCDMHGWIEREPSALTYPLSPRFKNLLTKFNIPDVAFYVGSVQWKGAEQEYYVMQLLTRQYQYIDFEASTFEECDFRGRKRGKPPVKGDSWPELRKIFGSKLFTFSEAVMRPAFEPLDMYHVEIIGILITERLKQAIEAAGLTGVTIKECSIDFTIGSQS